MEWPFCQWKQRISKSRIGVLGAPTRLAVPQFGNVRTQKRTWHGGCLWEVTIGWVVVLPLSFYRPRQQPLRFPASKTRDLGKVGSGLMFATKARSSGVHASLSAERPIDVVNSAPEPITTDTDLPAICEITGNDVV